MHVLRVVVQQESLDCAVAALAMYLGVTYPDVLRAVTVADRHQGRRGLWTRTMQRVARRLGVTLTLRRTVDVDTDAGILLLPDHACVLWRGLVFDTDGLVWDADAFLANRSLTGAECQLLHGDQPEV